ncbi:phosphopyruvate hydratase [Azospirillum sp. ST 5-10]|uniref:phosphopyruvate hydratase n=1 Tax=unclassified Azospirillum TaxID=2630922 RepID=UPI003F4A2B87
MRETPAKAASRRASGGGDDRIAAVTGRRLWDSRGRPTLEIEVHCRGGAVGRAIAAAGESRGRREAPERRDGGAAFGGHDVRQALADVARRVDPALRGRPCGDQAAIDAILGDLDRRGTERLGTNVTTTTSTAVACAAAQARGEPLFRRLAADTTAGDAHVRLPVPEIQIFGGGAHAPGSLEIQDFMVVPLRAASFAEALDRCAEVFRVAGDALARRGASRGLADQGGYWPAFATNEAALEALTAAIAAAGLTPMADMAIALDVGASTFRQADGYVGATWGGWSSTDAMLERLQDWCRDFPIGFLEDPLAQDDADGFRALHRALGDRVVVIGDDFLTTDAAAIRQAAAASACGGVIIKPYQAGSLTAARAALAAAESHGLLPVLAARSGDSEDVCVAHLAVGWAAPMVKIGGMARSERGAKFNELLRIEEALGAAATLARPAVGPFRTAGP